MKPILCAALLLAALAPEARAGFTDRDAGTAAGQFLKLPPDARSAALAGAAHSSSEDVASIYWNPAGLAALRYRDAMVSHTAYFQNVFYDFIGYAQPIDTFFGGDRRDRSQIANDYGAIGVGLVYLNAGQIGEVDNTGADTGQSFTPQDFCLMASWGLPINHDLELGVTGKFVSEKIRESAETGAIDVAARYHLRLFEIPYVLSGGIQNLGGRLKFFQGENQLPVTLFVGNTLRFTKNWTFSFDMVAARDGQPYPAIGSEYRFVVDPTVSAALRIGYQRNTVANDLSGFTGLGLGAGLGFSRFSVDYGWSPFGALGDVHHFSFSYRF
jgi:hypothetical protein